MITAYNPTIEKYRDKLPLPFVMSIIQHESDFNEKLVMGKGGAVGLMQIVNVALAEYNERKKTLLTRADMLNPESNIKVGCWNINFWLIYLKAGGLAPDFASSDYVQLLVMSWNSGGSHVLKAIKSLKAKGLDVTPANVKSEAEIILPGSWLAKRDLGWSKRVTSTFFVYKGYLVAKGI